MLILKIFFRPFLIIVLLLAAVRSEAQTVRWSQPLPDNAKLPYMRIIGSDAEGFYVLRSNLTLGNGRERSGFKTRKYMIQYFSNELTMRWEQELVAPGEQGHIADVQIVNERLMVVSYTYEKPSKTYRFSMQYLDEKGHWLGTPSRLEEFSAEDIDEDNKPGVIVARDQALFAFTYRRINTSTGEQSYIAVVADTSLTIVYKKEIQVPLPEKKFTPVSFLLTDDGNFYLLGIKFLTEKKVKAPGESFYELYGYNKSRDLVLSREVKIEDKFLTDVAVSADNENRKIVVAGFYSDKTTYSTAGVFYSAFSEDSLVYSKVVSSPFAPTFLQKFIGDRKENRNKELVNYSIDRLVLRRDGGVAIVAESYYQSSRTYWDYYTQSVISHYYYHYGNIMILSVNPDGKVLWNNVFSKDQNSVDDAGYYSSYASAISGGRIIAIYNKYADDNASVLSSSVDGNGNQKTDVLFNEIEKVSIIARSARQIDEETLVVPAYKENKFYMVSLTY